MDKAVRPGAPRDGVPPAALTRVTVSSDGLGLAAWEGPRHGPSVVFVHGYPDTHRVWNRVIDRLADRYHCIAYDVRGAGASNAPATTAGYAIPQLVSDLVRVLDRVATDQPVHLVGHDWGSVQLWDAVLTEPADERLTGRLASFTSISGPCIDVVQSFARTALSGGSALRRQAVGQAARSWYVYAFQLPVLPELVLRHLGQRLLPGARGRTGQGAHFAETLPEDAANGLGLYRANVLRRRPEPRRRHCTSLPVQLVVPLHDPYVTPGLAHHTESVTTQLTTVELDAGHWIQQTHPDELTGCLDSFISGVELSRPRRPPSG